MKLKYGLTAIVFLTTLAVAAYVTKFPNQSKPHSLSTQAATPENKIDGLKFEPQPTTEKNQQVTAPAEAEHSVALVDLSDVEIVSTRNNQLLRYDNGAWQNWSPSYISLSNLSASSPISYNKSNGTFSLSYNTSNLTINSANQLDVIQEIKSSASPTYAGLTVNGSISAATSNNTINDLVINDGALSGITGYSQTSGNFIMTSSGTFTTGTGLTTIGGDLYFSSTDPSITAPTGSSFNFTNKMVFDTAGNSGELSSTGGVIHLDMTDDIGGGLVIYSNAGASALGNMINVKVDNSAFAQAAFYMNYDGSSNAVEIVSNSTDTSSNALSVTGNNPNDSTVGVIGYETGRGTIKVTHNGTGSDTNASGLSIDLQGTGTKAQGLYVDSTAATGTTGNLLRLRNQTVDKFVVNYQGNLSMAGNVNIGATGTNTTLTKVGNTSGDEFFVGTNGAFRVQRATANSEAFRVQINGDTQGRWLGTSDGRLKWGDGATAQDVTLRRGAAGVLWLDGSLTVNNSNSNLDTLIKGVNDSSLLFVDASSDFVGIGTTLPGYKFQVQVDSTNEGHVSSTGSWANTSDLRLKKNIIDIADGLDKVLKLRPVTYDTINDQSNSGLRIGFIAQEVEQILPQIVDTDARGYKAIAYGQLTPILVSAIKEQNQILQSHENRLKQLESIQNAQEKTQKTAAGFAKIKKGFKKVKVTFDTPYEEIPIILATPHDIIVPFTVSERSKENFSIVIDKPANEDIMFSWSVAEVAGAKTFESEGVPETIPVSETVTPSLTPTPTPVELTITPTPSETL